MITQASQSEFNENRNVMWAKSGKAGLILIFSTITICESTPTAASRQPVVVSGLWHSVAAFLVYWIAGCRSLGFVVFWFGILLG